MLPRRHILDVLIYTKKKDEIFSMATLSLAIDALKYLSLNKKNNHFVQALELNDFICYMFPHMRPKNRALLLHIVSDLIGLLAYGVPKKSKKELESLETIDYSKKDVETYPLVEIWNKLKDKIYKKKHGPLSIVEGFIKKIRVEMDIIERYPKVEEVFHESKRTIREWVSVFTRFYFKEIDEIPSAYERWWALWKVGNEKERILNGMVDRLCEQAQRDLGITINKNETFESIIWDKNKNRLENENFSRWYSQGIKLLFNI
ncbi:MAG: hypothetical protein N2513_00225 [Deltaproteobacteria bacterium]|nr:hypothetical protein [Deltaproteobacteria bacterium]